MIKWIRNNNHYIHTFALKQPWGMLVNLNHLGGVMHISVSNLSIVGSDNDLSPGRRQAII